MHGHALKRMGSSSCWHESSSEASCSLQFNDGVSALKPATATACPFAGVHSHALHFVSMHQRACPCAALRVSVYSMSFDEFLTYFSSVLASVLKPIPTPSHTCPSAGMRVHLLACASIFWRAHPWGAVCVHARQFTSMRFKACPCIFQWNPITLYNQIN